MALSVSLALPPAVVSAQVPAGPVFQVNVYTTADQSDPRIAADEPGNFVITWTSRDQDGDSRGVFARRYDAAGNPVEPADFQVNTFTTGSQARGVVAADPAGPILFAWHSEGRDGSELAVQGRIFDTGEFTVNTYTTGSQAGPAVAGGRGNFVVVWSSASQDGSDGGVFARTAFGDERAVNLYTTGSQGSTSSAVAMADSGAFVVVWQGEGEGDPDGVFARRFDGTGMPAGPQFRVNVHTYLEQARPAVASDPAGNFVVAWASENQPGPDAGVLMARRYDASGAALGSRRRTCSPARSTRPGPRARRSWSDRPLERRRIPRWRRPALEASS